MKKYLLVTALLLLVAVLAANVVIARAVERVWFDDADNFWVRFGPEAMAYDLTSLMFSTSSGTYSLPDDYTPPSNLPYEVNLTQAIPGFTIFRAADSFRAYTNPSWDDPDEHLSWGPQNDFSVNLHPLSAGQSAVQFWVPVPVYEGEYDTATVWAKDSGTAYVNPYYPSTRCTLSVYVERLSGGPAPWVPIFLQYFPNPYFVWPIGHTNENGWWQAQYFYAQRTRIKIKDPIDGHYVYDELVFPEPGEHIHIDATVWYSGVEDETQIPGMLELRPSVLTAASGNTLHLEYKSGQALFSSARLGLYDLRGRHLADWQMPASGETDWLLPRLASGIYFISLEDGSRVFARQRLTVLR